MIVGHRWQYDYVMRWYQCMPLPIGGVESHQWCVGCGCKITKNEIYESKLREVEIKDFYLDMLASWKGFAPIEAGTYAAYKLTRCAII